MFHPLKTRDYANTARALRSLGRDCIKKRIELVESGAEVPNDILTHILQVACKYLTIEYMLSSNINQNIYETITSINTLYTNHIIYTATQTTVDIEELVDDFVTYYIAGMLQNV